MGRRKEFEPDVVIDRAVAVFWRKGYASTTPQDLVRHLGIGKGSLYNAFTSKRALFGRSLQRYGDDRVAGLIKLLARPGTLKVRIAAVLEQLAQVDRPGSPPAGCLAVNTAAEFGEVDEAVTKLVQSIFDRMERAFQQAIEEAQRMGEIDKDRDCRELASLLLTTSIGMSVVTKTAGRKERLRRVVDALIASF